MSALAGVLLRDLQPESLLHHVRDGREVLAGPPRPGCSVRRQRLFQNGHAVEVRAGHPRGEEPSIGVSRWATPRPRAAAWIFCEVSGVTVEQSQVTSPGRAPASTPAPPR